MKIHLPITLLSAVLAAFIALPVQAVEAPEGYTTIYLNTPGELESYSTLTEGDYQAYLLGSALEFSPSSAEYWTSSTPLVSGGNVFFGSNDSDSPVALSFKDGEGPAFSGQKVLTFDTLSNLTFSTIEGNDAAINLADGGTLTIANVNDGQSETVDVLFKDNITNPTASDISYGGAICADYVAISHNGDVSFSGNADSSPYRDGGAIYATYDVTISHNGDVSFSGNSATQGGAIYADNDVTISHNGDVSFSGNSATRDGGIYAHNDVTISHNGDVSFSSSNDGNAIHVCNKLTISNNGNILFSKNVGSNNGSSTDGGAIYASSGLTISNNGNVSFLGNYAADPGDFINSHSNGGAIYAVARVTISNNGDVSFSGNYVNTSSDEATMTNSAMGGAIYAKNGLTISNNGDVSFSDNYAINTSAADARRSCAYGGAIYTYSSLTIRNNGNVSFSGNSATACTSYNDPYTAAGGAIYSIGLSIQGNDSVLFEKNYENYNGIYNLRSIFNIGQINLASKTGGHITFRDSVYIYGDSYFNSDYTDADGNTQSAKGDIIFSGKYAEQHLNEILAANNEDRTATASEILNSQTSIFKGNVYLNGGSLQIKDGAVLNINGDTVNIAAGSDATLAISDAELVAANATIEVGESATLQLSNGASVTADEINIAAGATLALGDIAITASASDAMVAAYRLSSLNIINADLTFAAGSTLVTDGTGINMTEGSVLTFNATSEGEKVNLVLTLGTEYSEDGLVQLFSNVDIVKFLMDGEEVDSSSTLLASDFFTGDYINENTTLTYDSTNKVVYLEGVSKVVPEPTTATLSLLALAALAMRRRRK